MLRLPQEPEGYIPYLASLGAAVGTGKLLASKQELSWRAVLGRAIEGACLAMSAGIVFVLPFETLKALPPFALLGVGGLLASLGVSGLIGLARALRGSGK